MHVADLPLSSRVGLSADENALAHALRSILGGFHTQYRYANIVHGGQTPGRVFFTQKPEDAPYLHELSLIHHDDGTPKRLSHDLMVLVPELLQEPGPDGLAKRGFEIRSASLHLAPIAIAWATWI